MKKIPDFHSAKKFVFLAACLFIINNGIQAQPFTLQPEIKPVELKLNKFNPSKQSKAKGRINITDVTQVKDTLYFFAKGISIYSPVYVAITSKDPGSSIDVRLHKMNWKKADRSGTTNDKGHWDDKFKTENDFGIMVIPKTKPAVYSLVVWTGDEAKIELPTIFKKEDGSSVKSTGEVKGDSFLKKNLLYIIIGVLAIAILVLFLKLKNRKNEKQIL